MLQATGYPGEIPDFYSAISAGYLGVFLVAKTVQLVMSLYFPSLSVLRTSPHSLNALWNRLDFVERHSSEAFVLAPFSGSKFVHDGQCEY